MNTFFKKKKKMYAKLKTDFEMNPHFLNSFS